VSPFPDRPVQASNHSSEEPSVERRSPPLVRVDGWAPLLCAPASLVVSREDASLGLNTAPHASGLTLTLPFERDQL
jgi:hypothetical protein